MSITEQFVTNLISNYISNEGDMDGDKRIAEHAAEIANNGDIKSLEEYVTRIVRTHASSFTAEVRNELAPNDWDRINWNEVARQLRD